MNRIDNTEDCIVLHTVYLGLGTNLGNKKNNIESALMRSKNNLCTFRFAL